jgi:inosose dehydratase
MTSFTVGFAPITWNNEDLEDLRPAVAYTTVLDEIQAAGYAGTELGDGFPRDAAELKRALAERGLAMPSAWCGLSLLNGQADLEHARRVCALLAEAGARFVNLAHQGTRERRAWAGRAADPGCPKLSAAEWDRLAERVSQAAEIARAAGLQAAFHLHVGTWIETQADLDELLQRTDPGLVKLCWDVGHAVYAGVDPSEVVRRCPERIAYVHLKDVDGAVLDGLRIEGASFEDGIRRRVFTELGRGRLDLPGLLQALRVIGYAGWLMVEQDSTWLAPLESARTSRAALRALGV